jgi:two-component system LytT family sensor kinase
MLMLWPKKRNWIEILLHIAFWTGVFYTLTSLTGSNLHMRLKTKGMFVDQYETNTISPYMFLTVVFLATLFYTNIFWVFRKIIQYKSGMVRLGISAGWFMVIFAANYFMVGLLLDHTHADTPINPPVFSIRTRDSIHLVLHAPRQMPPHIDVVNFMVNTWLHLQLMMLLVFLAILGLSVAYFFLKEWAKSELIQNQLHANQLSTEIKFLKSQINPYFLFNTLNNLFSMAQGKGNDELADGISKLSGMMRYMIYESNEDSVPLKKEIEYLQNCIVLNKLRYADDEVKVAFDFPDKTEGVFVAPMLFIPFVENAFKHGVSIGQSSQIDIAILLNGKQLLFSCENTSYSFIKKMAEEKSGIGLQNVKRRLELVYPGKHRLVIDDADGKFNVNLEIDLG